MSNPKKSLLIMMHLGMILAKLKQFGHPKYIWSPNIGCIFWGYFHSRTFWYPTPTKSVQNYFYITKGCFRYLCVCTYALQCLHLCLTLAAPTPNHVAHASMCVWPNLTRHKTNPTGLHLLTMSLPRPNHMAHTSTCGACEA